MKTLALLAIFWPVLDFAFAVNCPRECRCDLKRKIVFCNERGLKYVPYGIPTDTRILHLQGNVIVNSPTSEENFRRLTNLKRLDLHENKLTSFPKRLPSSLEYISLQRNHLKYVGRDVLSGLTRLTELHLDGNNITNAGISQRAFRNARALQVLVMTGNFLTSLPVNLPPSVRFLRLDKNRISTVSVAAAQSLTGLVVLDLSRNRINSGLEEGAFFQLSNLRSVNLQANLLRAVPKYLPAGLTELLLAKNKIKYIRSHPAGLNGLNGLAKLDLSSNLIESVEAEALEGLKGLKSIELHDNPWRCDCYLMYLKTWTETTASIIGSRGNVQCRTPSVFQGVTLGSIDVETLAQQCSPKRGSSLHLDEVQTDRVRFTFTGFQSYDPDYLSYMVVYGKLLCPNCTVAGMETHRKVSEVVDIVGTTYINVSNNEISNLAADTHYVICVYTSYSVASDVTTTSCTEFRTAKASIADSDIGKAKTNKLPSWLVVTLSAMLFSTVVLIIIVVVWKVYTSRSRVSKTTYTTTHERYRPPQYLQPDVTYPTAGNGVEIHTYSGNDVKRCCAGLSASTTTLDARPEFDVALLVRSQHHARATSHSDVASTTQTGMTEANSSIDGNAFAAVTLPRRPTSQIYSHFHCDVTPRHTESRYSWFGAPSTDLDDTGVYV